MLIKDIHSWSLMLLTGCLKIHTGEPANIQPKTEEKTEAGEKVPTAKIIQLKQCLDKAPTPRDQ